MPTVTVPLIPATDVPALKKSKAWARYAAEEAKLALLEKQVEARRAELKLELYDVMNGALPGDVKSVRYDYTYTDPETKEKVTVPLQFTKLDGGNKSKSFDKAKLLEIPIPCPRKGCKGVAHVDADMLEECVTYGTPSKPTVSVTVIKGGTGGER